MSEQAWAAAGQVAWLDSPKIQRPQGGSVPAEWLSPGAPPPEHNGGGGQGATAAAAAAAAAGGGDGDPAQRPELKKRLSDPIAFQSVFPKAPTLRKGGSLKLSGSGLGFDDFSATVVKRKVSFRGELEETQLYAPTPTKKNPGGVGQTPSKLAPFVAAGSAEVVEHVRFDEPGSPEGEASAQSQRVLRQAAGRWVIPPAELVLGRRIGRGSFGEVFTADWQGTEVALKQMNDKSVRGAAVEEFTGEIQMMQGLRQGLEYIARHVIQRT